MATGRRFEPAELRASFYCALLAIAPAFGCSAKVSGVAEPVSFAREIQPILAEHCFACHGPDPERRQAGLRLDQSDSIFNARPNGPAVIVKGRPRDSLLFQRISAADGPRAMPPPSAQWHMTPAQVALVGRWISEGAEYTSHWAFMKPVRPALPQPIRTDWPRNPIDSFVEAALEDAGISPGAEETRGALIRRASLDVVGLPPRSEEIAAFLSDEAPNAYEALIDRLLASPAYGEQRAHYWLDVARYADTHGLLQDNYRSIWPYRDYVIRAFNDDMPFDRFTVEQLAGDLLPEPTLDQQVATGFGRCAMSTNELNLLPEEYDAVTAKDRAETTAVAWLGLTIGCASCHAHMFDPISQSEYYGFAAFFRNTTQPQVDGDQANTPPVVLVGPEATPTLVTAEKPGGTPTAYVLTRGEYDKPGLAVTAGVPKMLPNLPAGQPANRLGLARWFVSPDHPLTARVVMNRFWAEIFGVGIVATPDNFGQSGAAPSNQALLDWLAVEFQESGWDVKHMFRLILTSATYRQSSVHRPEAEGIDPDNRLMSRGPRFRMDAETLRDQALFASDLLVTRIGGPSVKPYQPDGVWESASSDSSSTHTYQRDVGEGLFRRSVYTFWKRKAPPPAMEIFDAPSRERSIPQRDRSNTPLQALVTMNDVQFLEAARHLATVACATAGTDVNARLDFMGLRVLSRPFDDTERAILLANLTEYRRGFDASLEDAMAALAVGDTPVDSTVPPAEQAAWMLVASEIFNLDEAINK